MNTATLADPVPIVSDEELYEVIDGVRVRTPPMGVFAVWVASEIHFHLSFFARTQNLGRAIAEALFHLPAPIKRDRRPDVAFVGYDRWAKSKPMPPTDNAWDVVPNLVVEVVSPTDTADEVHRKTAEYFRAGVQLVWVVYPTQAEVYVYSSPTQVGVLTKADTLDGGTVLPGFQLALADLFTETSDATNGAVGGT